MREPSLSERPASPGRGRVRPLPRRLEDEHEDDWGTLKGGPERVKKPVRYDLWRNLALNLIRAAIVGIVPTTLAVGATLGVWVTTSAVPVRAAATEMRTAQDTWFRTLEQSQPVLSELGTLGAPTPELEVVYFAFLDAPESGKAQSGDVLLGVLSDQAVAVRAQHGDRASEVPALLSPANQTRRAAAHAYDEWVTAATSPGGRLAVLFGLAPAPDGTWARYAVDHPRG